MEKSINEIIETVKNEINFIEFHKDLAFNDFGMKLLVWEDGKTTIMSQNSMPMDPSEKYITFPCWGIGNVQSDNYSEGFYTQTEEQSDNGMFLNPETETELTLSEMVSECIEEGDFSEYHEEWLLEIERKFKENY
ncbi:MAG: hypothetical protein GY714_18360 [Desulfobacterales bacterium]|nr:hypothetical protein [Desulfobacterales bacterium]